MKEKKKQALKQKLANVPNPPVPNRAHTEMKADSKNEAKNQAQNKNEQNCK
jgi:hypothetical protein